ncbi:MAG: divalent-cation tolerance protein CutA [Candidatus Odinarchaeia archaeon]
MYKLVIVTASSLEEAEKIAETLVKDKKAACVNLISNVTSVYSWKGKLCKDSEVILLIKTIQEKLEDVILTVKSIHSYEVPEIISIPIEKGLEEYLEWVKNSVKE